MNQSESIAKLAAALCKAQGTMKHAVKDAENPFFRSKYADLASVVEASRPSLVENGLSVVQYTVGDDLWTMLLHESGEWIKGYITLKPMRQVKDKGWEESRDPQSYGSCITYARRYAMAAITGVATEDDDGNAASGNKVAKGESVYTAPTPAPSTSAAPQGAGNATPASPLAPPDNTDDEYAMRDYLIDLLERISILKGADAPGVLYALTVNKDGKFGKLKVSDVPWEMPKKRGDPSQGTWSPLKKVISDAKKMMEEEEAKREPGSDDGVE